MGFLFRTLVVVAVIWAVSPLRPGNGPGEVLDAAQTLATSPTERALGAAAALCARDSAGCATLGLDTLQRALRPDDIGSTASNRRESAPHTASNGRIARP
jgi:hypothetical protein